MPTSAGLLIAESSLLIALAKLLLLDLPSQLFGRVVMSDVVYQECTARTGLPDAQAIKAAVATGAIEVLPVRKSGYFISPSLQQAVLIAAGELSA